MSMGRNRIVIVIPTFNDHISLCMLIEQLCAVFSDARASEVSLLIVDDGSVPPLVDLIAGQFKSALRGRILTLKRNLGHERAIAIGIAAAAGDDLADILVVMDADGEDKPADVVKLVATIGHRDQTTIAVGER